MCVLTYKTEMYKGVIEVLMRLRLCPNMDTVEPVVQKTFTLWMHGSLTGVTVCELEVIQRSPSAHVSGAYPLEDHFKVPQLPQGNLRPVPLLPLVPGLVPHLRHPIVLSLWRGQA